MTRIPVVLTVAGLDPSGGAGVIADALRIAREGAHPLAVVSALTVQDTRGVAAVEPVNPRVFEKQLRALFSDIKIRAVKIGLLPSARHVAILTRAIPKNTIVVLDPVLVSSSGARFANAATVEMLRSALLPRAALVTPNLDELRELTGMPAGSLGARRAADSLDERRAAARELLHLGVRAVLAKGGHAKGARVTDLLITARGEWRFAGTREPQSAHGTGCALASSIAARLALGEALPSATGAAIRRLRLDLRRRWAPGHGRPILGL
jgi:hydroxymethylpyrimidine/phosphomethylpyrimidine kinase